MTHNNNNDEWRLKLNTITMTFNKRDDWQLVTLVAIALIKQNKSIVNSQAARVIRKLLKALNGNGGRGIRACKKSCRWRQRRTDISGGV